jgi:PTH1 family peptidyl-tRNA hydrolase
VAKFEAIELVVGLGNPGAKYEATRHNVGFWFVEDVARRFGVEMRSEARFKGLYGDAMRGPNKLRLLMPETFMNRSGEAAVAVANFYKIPPARILVVHDELDLDAGTMRLKRGGGHGGHNGLRDLHRALGGGDYNRLRIGIGHPGVGRDVTGYVLGKPCSDDLISIRRGMEDAERELDSILDGDWNGPMNKLHQKKINE